jgi:hypothetical protein
MTKLLELCNDVRFSERQKSFFWGSVETSLRSYGKNYLTVAERCMSEVWIRYDLGGISIGRSLRAVVLEQSFDLLRKGFLLETIELVSILVAMYHSPDYINTHRWFDYPITIEDLPITERAFLVTALMSLTCFLDVEIPDISLCTSEYILKRVEEGKEKIRKLEGG